jgi:hypothetical protein
VGGKSTTSQHHESRTNPQATGGPEIHQIRASVLAGWLLAARPLQKSQMKLAARYPRYRIHEIGVVSAAL